MLKDANYRLTFSQQGAATGSPDPLGNPVYSAPVETTILCSLKRVPQGNRPGTIDSAGIEVSNRNYMLGFVLKPGKRQRDGSTIPETNVIPDFVKTGVDCTATHIKTGRSGRFKFHRRELDMSDEGHRVANRYTGAQIYGYLLMQE